MYRRDVPRIVDYVKSKGPDGLVDVAAFCLATIQTPLSRTAGIVQDIRIQGVNSKYLWGSKRPAFQYVQLHKEELFEMLLKEPVRREIALERLLVVPGLGLPKASFLLQCIGYPTACLDSHNLSRYGLSPNITKVGRVQVGTLRKKIDNYLTVCDNVGPSEYHWDSWVTYVSGNRANRSLPTASMVSDYHTFAITGERTIHFQPGGEIIHGT